MSEAASVRFLEVQRERWTAFRVAMLCFGAYVGTWYARALVAGFERGDLFPSLIFNLPMFLFMGVGVPLGVLFGRFETRVDEAALHLRRTVFGYAFRKRRIALDRIRSVELGSCYPNIDSGSWSTHTGGPRGVRVHIREGEPVQIATGRPEELVAALKTPAEPPAAGSPKPGSPSSP